MPGGLLRLGRADLLSPGVPADMCSVPTRRRSGAGSRVRVRRRARALPLRGERPAVRQRAEPCDGVPVVVLDIAFTRMVIRLVR